MNRGIALTALLLTSLASRAADPGAPPSALHPVADTYHSACASRIRIAGSKIRRSRGQRWSGRPGCAHPAPISMAWRSAADLRSLWPDLHDLEFVFTPARGRPGSSPCSPKPPKQQPMIALLTPPLDAEPGPRIIVDPNALNPKGTTAIDWFVPSPDGKLVAVSLSENGSEDGTLHVYDVRHGASGRAAIARVQYPTAGGSLAWRADSEGFWYTRYPGPDRPAEEQHFFQQVYFHRIGRRAVEGRLRARRGTFRKSRKSPSTTASIRTASWSSVANGDGGEFAHYVISRTRTTRAGHATSRTRSSPPRSDRTDQLVPGFAAETAPRGKLLKLEPGSGRLAHAPRHRAGIGCVHLQRRRRVRRRARSSSRRHGALRARARRRPIARGHLRS